MYGPPGTGKTYHSVNYAVAICDGKELNEVEKESYAEVLARYNELRDAGRIAFTTFHVAKMLETINRRIEYLFDREHTIGHAFFTKLADDPSIETLASIFEKNVIPLLQEYFYEDYEKIQLVLGDNTKDDELKFILDQPLKVKDIFNGAPDIDLPEKGFSIQHEAFMKLECYKQIARDL